MWNHTHTHQCLFFLFLTQVDYKFIPDAQIIPLDINTSLKGGKPDKIYLAVGPLKTKNWGCTLGMAFLLRFRLGVDFANNQVGLGETPYTKAIINSVALFPGAFS